jgi:hypothetical protein
MQEEKSQAKRDNKNLKKTTLYWRAQMESDFTLHLGINKILSGLHPQILIKIKFSYVVLNSI